MPESPAPQRHVRSSAVHRRRRLIAVVVVIALLVIGVDAVRGESPDGFGSSLQVGEGLRTAIAVPWIQRPRDALGRQVGINGLPTPQSQGEIVSRLAKQGTSIYCAGGTKPYVALTFDDGPAGQGDQINEMLKAAKQRATWYTVGSVVAEAPDKARKRLESGDLANHSYTHPDLTTLSPADRKSQIANTTAAIRQAASNTPVLTMRPPFGARDAAVDKAITRAGLLPVLWSIDSSDWTGIDKDTLLANVVPYLKPGAIILFHETKDNTVEALPTILAEMKKRGLRSVTVPELLAMDPPTGAKLTDGINECNPDIGGDEGGPTTIDAGA